jgi:hypothetical protein
MPPLNSTAIFQIRDTSAGAIVLDAGGKFPLEYYDQAAAQIEANRLTATTKRQHVVVRAERS